MGGNASRLGAMFAGPVLVAVAVGRVPTRAIALAAVLTIPLTTIRAGAVARTAEVVDHHAGTLGSKGQRILATQPAAGAGDDDDSILYSGHGHPL